MCVGSLGKAKHLQQRGFCRALPRLPGPATSTTPAGAGSAAGSAGAAPGPAAEGRPAPPQPYNMAPHFAPPLPYNMAARYLAAAGRQATARRRRYSFRLPERHYVNVDPRVCTSSSGSGDDRYGGGVWGPAAPIRPHPRPGGSWGRPVGPGGCGEGPAALLPALGPAAGAELRGGEAGPP